MLELGVKFLISYFIGSLMGAMIMGKLKGGVDIRTMGSGNAGGTNALRTQGIWFALGVVIVDVGKGVVGAGVVPGLDLPFVPQDPSISRTWLTLCCGLAAVFGHVWPVYHGFKGGKGAATFVGTLVFIAPVLIIGVLLWSVVHLATTLRLSVRSAVIEKIGSGPYKGIVTLLLSLAGVYAIVSLAVSQRTRSISMSPP